MTWINCTGDVVAGDTIRFTETVWPAYKPSGRFRRASKPTPLGERTITAKVLRDSYGAAKQQHTFTLQIISCEGYEPLEAGTETTRKGRNIYRNGVERLPWPSLAARGLVAADKHQRGDAARQARAVRREMEEQ